MSWLDYKEEREKLLEIFPRGRFFRDSDDSCLLKAIKGSRRGDFAYVQEAGFIVGIFYRGTGECYRNRLKDLIMIDQRLDGEGLMYVRWSKDLAKRLPWFSRRPPPPVMIQDQPSEKVRNRPLKPSKRVPTLRRPR